MIFKWIHLILFASNLETDPVNGRHFHVCHHPSGIAPFVDPHLDSLMALEFDIIGCRLDLHIDPKLDAEVDPQC